jgi:uncharacterized protein YlxW (UPF0749 family)
MAPTDSGDGRTSPDSAVETDDPTDGHDEATDDGGESSRVETLAAQVEQLESEVADLRETVEAQDRTIQFLAGDADLEPLEAACPECGHTPLRRESGVTWKQLVCDDCGQKWYL